MNTQLRISPVRCRNLTRATNLRTPQKPMSPLNRQMSPVLEKAGRLVRTRSPRNLQMLTPPKRMYLVVRQECRRAAGSRRLRSGNKV